jgi:acyl-coenzyme A thioesterase PaaI-like protein
MKFGTIPEGFSPCVFDVAVPFSDQLKVYHRVHEDGVDIGAWILDEYRNGGPMAHGGFLMTLGDIATGFAVNEVMGQDRFTVHVSFNMSFYAGVPVGSWLLVRASVGRRGRELVFAGCDYWVGDQRVGRGEAVLKSSPRRPGTAPVKGG